MDIGIGLPNPVPGCAGPLLVQWARRAEERGFSTLGTIDRVAFPTYDSLVTHAAAAAVTTRIGLLTNILVLPTRDPVLLAKEAASVAAISEGRFTLGIGVGGREDDFTASGTEYAGRGKRADAMLETMTAAWRGEPVAGSPEPVVPDAAAPVPLLVGGSGAAGIRRTVQYGVGWTAGGTPPEQIRPVVEQVRQAWREGGRDGEPRIVALAYYSLGADAEEASYGYLRRYYGFMADYVDYIAGGALRSAEALRAVLPAYEDAGVGELILNPTVASLDQVDRLADAVL